MPMTRTTRTGILLLVLAQGLAGCSGSSHSASSPLPSSRPVAVAVTSISPNAGPASRGTQVSISGAGFQPGATVTLGGAATDVRVIGSDQIVATTPLRAAGTADVIVTNPGGQSATLTAGYTFRSVSPPTLTPSASTVAPGGQLSVRWSATLSGPSDWIGLFIVGDRNEDYAKGWFGYTEGSTSGTFTLTAPTAPGQYEFRYLLDDGLTDVARSSVVTVSM